MGSEDKERRHSCCGRTLVRFDSNSSTSSLTELLGQTAMIKRGLKDLSRGIGEEEAEELWREFDRDGNGYLDADEVRNLFKHQANVSCDLLQRQMDRVCSSLDDPTTTDALLRELDISGDGKVQQEEFVKLAMGGIRIPIPKLPEGA